MRNSPARAQSGLWGFGDEVGGLAETRSGRRRPGAPPPVTTPGLHPHRHGIHIGRRRFCRIASASGAHLTYPALMVDTFGNFFVGHSVSSTSQNPTAGMSFAPVGTFPSTFAGIDYATGAGTYSNIDSNGLNRWGDYSGAARDPVNAKDVWFAEEYGSTSNTNQGRWGTQIGRFTQAPPTVTGVSPNSAPELSSACAPTVTVTGTDFVTGQTTVAFGGTVASSVTVGTTPDILGVVAPSHVRGTDRRHGHHAGGHQPDKQRRSVHLHPGYHRAHFYGDAVSGAAGRQRRLDQGPGHRWALRPTTEHLAPGSGRLHTPRAAQIIRRRCRLVHLVPQSPTRASPRSPSTPVTTPATWSRPRH